MVSRPGRGWGEENQGDGLANRFRNSWEDCFLANYSTAGRPLPTTHRSSHWLEDRKLPTQVIEGSNDEHTHFPGCPLVYQLIPTAVVNMHR